MVRKMLWLLVSCLMVLSLVIASCGGDEPDGGVEPDGGDEPVVDTSDEPVSDGTFNSLALGTG